MLRMAAFVIGKQKRLPAVAVLLLIAVLCANASAARDYFSHVQSEEVKKWSIVEAEPIGSSSPSEFEAWRYFLDSQVAIQQALDYLHNLTLDADSKNAWVFDIGDTSLCNIPYYREHHWGGEEYNSTAKGEWEAQERAEALPSTLKLYKALLAKGVIVFFISGKKEKSKTATRNNLLKVGYTGFAGLTVRGASDNGKTKTAVVYKSEQREKLLTEGYRILGNVGDQWSDIPGWATGDRTFKLPNPMYYIS
eukprot:Gb_28927 [translate_table: standard]